MHLDSLRETLGRSCLLALLLLASGCRENGEQASEQKAPRAKAPFIKTALAGADVPFNTYSFRAERGDTLYDASGSIIVFPANALVDKKGNPVTGDVKVTFRAFADPLDFFLAGIPMHYDSAGTSYAFESAGMAELYALWGADSLYVNPDRRPQLHLPSSSRDPGFNLYYLDTLDRHWENRGKDVITQVNPRKATLGRGTGGAVPRPAPGENLPPPPVRPVKADGTRPSFSIDIEPGTVSELQAYHNLKFEIDPADKRYDPQDASVGWTDVKVDKGQQAGTYLVTFSNQTRSVAYVTRPVFEGEDYEKALQLFEAKKKEYDTLLASRLTKEKKQAAQNEAQQKENERIAGLNVLIAARNEQFEENRKKMEARSKEIEAKNRQIREYNEKTDEKNRQIAERTKQLEAIDRQIDERNQEGDVVGAVEERDALIEQINRSWRKTKKDLDANGEIIRTFSVAGFGVWNCDKPVVAQGIPVKATFIDKAGAPIPLTQVHVIYKYLNGVVTYYGGAIKVVPNSETMIWSVSDDKFIYLGYDDFKKCAIDAAAKEYTFTMNVHPDKVTSREDIEKLLSR